LGALKDVHPAAKICVHAETAVFSFQVRAETAANPAQSLSMTKKGLIFATGFPLMKNTEARPAVSKKKKLMPTPALTPQERLLTIFLSKYVK